MQQTTTYLIIWNPPNHTLDEKASYLEGQFLLDLGGSYYGIMSQYSQAGSNGGPAQHIQPIVHYGGAVVDDTPYPHETQAAPLTDADLQAEVRNVINNQTRWQAPGTNVLYEVMLAENVEFCDGVGDCTFPSGTHGAICGYHGSFSVNGTSVIYANVGNQGGNRTDCGGQGGAGSSPNDPHADADVSVLSHETFEAVTDPLLSAWRTPSGKPNQGQEIGDLCAWQFGTEQSDGSNLNLSGTKYQVQEEWSNSWADSHKDADWVGCQLISGAVHPASDYPACTANYLPANDDGSLQAALPFTADFFSKSFTSLWVNNDGNITFDGPQPTYTPYGLTATGHEIIAPYFADVDTRNGSGIISYGGAPATATSPAYFCVEWPDVGYFDQHTERRNSFQLLLIDRSAQTGRTGDFDVEFDYDKIQWETGDASGGSGGMGGTPAVAGYSNGVNAAFQLPGSGVTGMFEDGGELSLAQGSQGSSVAGRYVFPVRNNGAPNGGTIHGTVSYNVPGTAVSGAAVQACEVSSGACSLTQTNKQGVYSLAGLPPGNYLVTVNPPSGSHDIPDVQATVLAANADDQVDLTLSGFVPLPNSVSMVTPAVTADNQPVLQWGTTTALNFTGCPGGQATAVVKALNGSGSLTVPMADDRWGLGEYSATIPDPKPLSGVATVTITNSCPDTSQNQTVVFDVYTDPSGTVVDTSGAPLSGATVTLLRSDSATGPFTPLPDGSSLMSPANRANPSTTKADGRFGWDVLTGYYEVQASKPGCTNPVDPSSSAVITAPFQVPPPMTDLKLTLRCTDPTVLTLSAVSGDYHDATKVTAKLADVAGTAVAGKTVSFTLDGRESCTGTTDAMGAATCSITPSEVPGPYVLQAAFAGDAGYGASNASAAFTVTKEETATAYTGPVLILQGGTGATLSGRLLEDGDPTLPLAGRTLTLRLGGQSCTGTTDTTGTASCTLVPTGPLGPTSLAAAFDGDAYYLASADTGKSATVFAFPSNGDFVLGDGTVTAASPAPVTWWGADWSALNQVTGGAAPPQFKGFASTVTLPTTTPPAMCGTPWTARPGNSGHPPAVVPSYMGVLVTDSVTDSGPTVSGTTTHIVVVKTDPGYQGNPGHPGTGTIIGVYC